jgi:hypothetical protein
MNTDTLREMVAKEPKHAGWGTHPDKWICPTTGKHFTFTWMEGEERVCNQCRPNAPSLGSRLRTLNDKRKEEA